MPPRSEMGPGERAEVIKIIEIALGVVYRRTPQNELEFLVVKRVPEDGDFWQPITGGIEPGETTLDTVCREVAEEIGIEALLHVSDELLRSEWGAADGRPGIDVMHVVEVAYDAEVRLNPAEHEDHRWLPLEEAELLLKYDNNREALRHAHRYIQEQHTEL